MIERTTDTPVISAEVEHRRDLDTLTDMLGYLRSLKMAGEELEHQVPPRRQHIYLAHAREGRPIRTALQSSSGDLITPQAGERLIPAFDKHLRKHLHTMVHRRLHRLLPRVLIDADHMFRSRHQTGHPVGSVPDSALTPDAR